MVLVGGLVGVSVEFRFWSIGLCVRAAERTKRVEMEEVATKACTCVCDWVGGGRVRESEGGESERMLTGSVR